MREMERRSDVGAAITATASGGMGRGTGDVIETGASGGTGDVTGIEGTGRGVIEGTGMTETGSTGTVIDTKIHEGGIGRDQDRKLVDSFSC